MGDALQLWLQFFLKLETFLVLFLGFTFTWIYFLLVQQLEATAAKDARCGNAGKLEKERESHLQSGFWIAALNS